MTTYIKDPASTLDYVWDWGPWLGSDADSIDSFVVVPDPGITVEPTTTHDSTTVTVWLTGGTLGASYDVTVRITTVGGRTDERTNTFTIRNRHA